MSRIGSRCSPSQPECCAEDGDACQGGCRTGPSSPSGQYAASVHFTGGDTHQCGGHAVFFLRVGREQSAVAQHIDKPRCAARQAVHLVEGGGRKQWRDGAGDFQTMPHVGHGFFARQRLEVVAAGHPLRELAQVGAGQQLA